MHGRARDARLLYELLGLGQVERRARDTRIEPRARRREWRTAREHRAAEDHLVQGLAVDCHLERLAQVGFRGERRADVRAALQQAVLVPDVERQALVAEPGLLGDPQSLVGSD